MALELEGHDIMENLWHSMPKTDDGEHLKFTAGEVEQLWMLGFVDAERVSLDGWKNIMNEFRQADGFYILSKPEFFSLDQYRYKGEIHVPFDAMVINEGRYTDDGLDDLVSASIAPSCGLPVEKIGEFFTQLKKDFRGPDGLIIIRKPAKERIKALLDAYPSPLRNLELLLDEMFRNRNETGNFSSLPAEPAAQAPLSPKVQTSNFTTTPTSKAEARAQELKKLTQSKKTETEEIDDDGKPKVMLKNIIRSRRGMRS